MSNIVSILPLWVVSFFCIFPIAHSSSPRALIQITGTDLVPNQTSHHPKEIADPSAPYVTPEGKIRIYGTANYALEFENWDQFLEGKHPRYSPIELYHPNGVQLEGHQTAWDLAVHSWKSEEGKVHQVLYAGTMTPSPGNEQARWPEDNWNRRIYPFVPWKEEGKWRRLPEPLIGGTLTGNWIGHSYGHQFVADPKTNALWVFYEKVTEELVTSRKETIPFVTEIFARKMTTPFRASEPEVKILGVGTPPYPATRRTHYRTKEPNGFLVEGARPVRVQLKDRAFYLMGFSSGDFPTDKYGMNVAWSVAIEGPYQPLLNASRDDFLDLGDSLRKRHRLTWGPARPAFFADPKGEWWVLFHAVRKDILPDRDYRIWPIEPLEHFFRCVFLAPVQISWSTATPSIVIE